MPKIHLLEKSVAELIAAGEVVERPASVIKEMVENSIDAGSKRITVEIQRGGITMMRITDDGCGINHEDVPLAFMRHATSKIKSADDLDAIFTLGFRGEALAATASVSKIEMLTKTAENEIGTHYCIDGGVETLYEQTGCPNGTTIVVNDLFYNTPARMKFLKKDVSEGNAVAAVMDRVALSHPEISFKLIRDGKMTLFTSGDGKLESVIYTVLGRDFAKSIINIETQNDGISVIGSICKPISCRQSRAWQFVFLNGRFVHSGTVTAAVEQAYKNSAMVGKFPAFVLNIGVPAETVDVNVHPAKTEIRFSDERRIFDAVYRSVKTALTSGDTRPVINPSGLGGGFAKMSATEYRQQTMSEINPKKTELFQPSVKVSEVVAKPQVVNRLHDINKPIFSREEKMVEFIKPTNTKTLNVDIEVDEEPKMPQTKPHTTQAEDFEVRLIGEAFRTYIIAEKGNSIFLIDKHAAHERLLFEALKQQQTVETQALLLPQRVNLSKEEYDAAIENLELLTKAGFEVEDFGNGTLILRAFPSALGNYDAVSAFGEAVASLTVRGSVEIEKIENLYHTIACKAATKAGYRSSDAELLKLAQRILENNDIMYCPHGRPVAFELKKNDLEKHFGRIQ